ncbi:hypothetical protein Scep_019844 [Stephania cephalantha]|uniref:Uncharacterized protein n=1 Tax=Stephania cephalantha TaxID=152367 RepID=A0AAP0IBP0_9MAGN
MAPLPSLWDYSILIVIRPLFAIAITLSLIFLGWVIAWKLVLAHVPLAQEIRKSLRKKEPVKQKPPTGRLSRFYRAVVNSSSG